MSASERRTWAALVQAQMEETLPAAERVLILAGEAYREHLMDYLEQR
ncbi:MAG: DUF6884 domain-containing protein [Planctomycetota bacterium]